MNSQAPFMEFSFALVTPLTWIRLVFHVVQSRNFSSLNTSNEHIM